MKITQIYDVIIIGSGMSGLYSAYIIKKMSPLSKILIIEKNNKKCMGGRANNDIFYGVNINTGAGIGRKDTNPLLLKLCKELGVSYHTSISKMTPSKTLPEYVNIVEIIQQLKHEFHKNTSLYEKQCFRTFATRILGKKKYESFVLSSGYTDYENADVAETLYNYGFDDNRGGWCSVHLSWKDLVNRLAKSIGLTNFKFLTQALSINEIMDNNGHTVFQIHCQNSLFFSKKVIIATPITSILSLVPGAKHKNSLYQQIHGQHFLRVYAKLDKKSTDIMKELVPNYTIVPGPLQKIIPMNSEKGVYMIAYCDNHNADSLKTHLDNSYPNRSFFSSLIEKTLDLPSNSIHIIALQSYFWINGTHYYEPLHDSFKSRTEFVYKANHPIQNMLVVGEAVSRYQGWVEGALESVHNTVTKKWLIS